MVDDVATEWVGAIHMHSKYSDGLGKVHTIRKAAKRLGLDFCVLTDHDTLAARADGHEGYDGDLLFLVGSEITCADDSHYLGLGISHSPPAGLCPQAVIDAVRRQNGLGILAHPFDRGSRVLKTGYPWKDWTVSGYDAMELWTWLVDWSENTDTVFHLILGYFFPSLFIDGPDPMAFEQWAKINAKRFASNESPLPVIGSVDAHGYFNYRRSLRTIHTHVWAPEKTGDPNHDAQVLYTALRTGRTFIANDRLQPARGFLFSVEGKNGAYPQTGTDLKGPARIEVKSPANGAIRIFKGQQLVHAADGESTSYHASEPGTYRCEVWLQKGRRRRPWIFCNAVHVR